METTEPKGLDTTVAADANVAASLREVLDEHAGPFYDTDGVRRL